jgi:hypothetical protein
MIVWIIERKTKDGWIPDHSKGLYINKEGADMCVRTSNILDKIIYRVRVYVPYEINK